MEWGGEWDDLEVCLCQAQLNDYNIHDKFPPSPPPSSPVSSSNGSSWLAELAHGIPESNHQLKYYGPKDEKLNFAHENQFGRLLCNAQL